MKRTVIFHGFGCADGFCAAWAAWKKFGTEETEYVAGIYGELPPDVTDREVYILDFSYPREQLLGMANKAKSLIVLDHHLKAKDDLVGLPFAKFDMERSGAGLAWDELHGTSRPWIVRYVEDRDLWRFALPDSKAVNAWIGLTDRTFEAWEELREMGVTEAANRGRGVLAGIDHYVRETAKLARVVEFEGFSVPMVNVPYVHISEVVGHLAENAPFAIGWFQDSRGAYKYSLRSRGAGGEDVNAIAKKFGGGGHRNAAGFTLDRRGFEELFGKVGE